MLFWEILLKFNLLDMKKLVQWVCSHRFSAVTSCVAVVGNKAQPVVNVESTDLENLLMLLQMQVLSKLKL